MKKHKIFIANWKMNFFPDEVHDYFNLFTDIFNEKEFNDKSLYIGFATPFPYLYESRCFLDKSVKVDYRLETGAQDCSAFPHPGAYTGEVSAQMIKTCRAGFVIIGHSERRKYLNENSAFLKEKIQRALEADLKIIFCVGENDAERKNHKHFEVVKKQLQEVLAEIKFKSDSLIIAYEPVWAIGTGNNASPNQVSEMFDYIQHVLTEKKIVIDLKDIPILYGGSANSANAPELYAIPNVGGFLVGSASLKPHEFKNIILGCLKSSFT
jgi:triosephosphate isomerase